MDYTAKLLSEFPGATEFKAEDLLFAFQDGQSRKLAGAVLQAFCRAAVDELVKRAETAADDAEAAKNAIAALEVTASTLETGEPAEADVELKDGKFVISFGLPKGATGDKGSSIASIERTEGTGASGTTDTYTITMTDGSTASFNVYNGKDGTGVGDMTAAVYDPQGKRTDIFAAIEEAAKSGGVSSFKGRTGAVTPQSGDYTAAMVGAVPVSRTVNGTPLSEDIVIPEGVQMDLLWQNLSPTSSFSEQTVTPKNFNDYQKLLVYFRANYNASALVSSFFKKGVAGLIVVAQNIGGSYYPQLMIRSITFTESGIKVGGATAKSTNSNQPASSDNTLIPCYIYGIKGINEEVSA